MVENHAIDGDATKKAGVECGHNAANTDEDLQRRQDCDSEISKQCCEYRDKVDPNQPAQIILDRKSSAENAQMQHNAQSSGRGPEMDQIGAQSGVDECQRSHSKRAVTCQNDLSEWIVYESLRRNFRGTRTMAI